MKSGLASKGRSSPRPEGSNGQHSENLYFRERANNAVDMGVIRKVSNRLDRFSSHSVRSISRRSSFDTIILRFQMNLMAVLAAALMMCVVLPMSVQAAEPVRIVAFGDSLTAGYQLPSGKGFSDQLDAFLKDQDLNVEVSNAGVSGDTTSSGLARLDWSIPDGTDLVILELGANDALQGLPVDQARANLDRIIKRLKERNIAVLLAGMKAPPNMGEAYGTAFDAIYPDLAKKYDVPLYPFFLDGVAAQTGLNLADGIHPNEEGILVIVKKIAPFVADIVKSLQQS